MRANHHRVSMSLNDDGHYAPLNAKGVRQNFLNLSFLAGALTTLFTIAIAVSICVATYGVPTFGDVSDGATVVATCGDFGESGADYEDESTAVIHPPSIRTGNAQYKMSVLGGGAYETTNLSFSVAAYVEPKAARDSFAQFEGLSAAEVRSYQLEVPPSAKASAGPMAKFAMAASFYQALKYAPADRALRVVITDKPITRVAVAQNLGQQLTPFLTKEGADGREARIVAEFQQMFDNYDSDEFQVGDTLVFGVTDGSFSLAVNGNALGSVIGEPSLNYGFWGLFTDEKEQNEATDVRERIADRVPLLWMHGNVWNGIKDAETRVPGYDHPYNLSVSLYQTTNANFTGAADQSLGGVVIGNVGLFADIPQFGKVEQPADLLPALMESNKNILRGLRFKIRESLLANGLIASIIDAMRNKLNERLGDDPVRFAQVRRTLVDMFPAAFAADDKFHLMCDPDNTLVSAHNTIDWKFESRDSDLLCECIFDAYLGATSILGEGRNDLIAYWTLGDMNPGGPVDQASGEQLLLQTTNIDTSSLESIKSASEAPFEVDSDADLLVSVDGTPVYGVIQGSFVFTKAGEAEEAYSSSTIPAEVETIKELLDELKVREQTEVTAMLCATVFPSVDLLSVYSFVYNGHSVQLKFIHASDNACPSDTNQL